MEYFKDKIIPLLIGSLLAGFVALLESIFSDILPMIYPSLNNIPISLYIKIILFFATLLTVSFFLLLIFYNKSKKFKPFKKTGKYNDLKWIADIKEYDPHRGWDIWINFICPIHGVYLSRKDAEVPNCCYGVLWCNHCNKEYPFEIENSIVYLEEVEAIIKDEVISKIRLENKSL